MLKSKVVVLLGLLLASVGACGGDEGSTFVAKPAGQVVDQFMPDNDLWQFDCLNCESAKTEEEFNAVGALIHKLFDAEFAKIGETLVVQLNYTDPTVNAWCSRNGKTSTVALFGGLYRRGEVNLEGFMLVAAHELSHLLAYTVKSPQVYVQAYNKVSVEGVADEVGQGYFMRKMLLDDEAAVSKEIELNNRCTERFVDDVKDQEICTVQLNAGLQLSALLATFTKVPAPTLETMDMSVISKTNMTYPPVPCRLTCYYWGAMQNPGYPTCWYKQP